MAVQAEDDLPIYALVGFMNLRSYVPFSFPISSTLTRHPQVIKKMPAYKLTRYYHLQAVIQICLSTIRKMIRLSTTPLTLQIKESFIHRNPKEALI